MTNPYLLEAEWKDLYSKCMRKDVPPEIVRELRRMFYAGATAMMAVQKKSAGFTANAGETGRIAAVFQVIDWLDGEIKQFAKEVKEGKS